MKHHAERIRHLEQLAADLDRQIANAQELQNGNRPRPQRAPGPGGARTRIAGQQPVTTVRRARKHR